MDKESKEKIYRLQADLCRALGDPTRLEIIDLLKDGEKSVSELVEELGVRQAKVSQHLTIMRQRGVVVAKRRGLNVIYKLKHPKLTQACAMVREILADELADTKALYVEIGG